MSIKLSVPEILEQVAKAPNKAAKVAKLKELDNPVLRGVLSINFEPTIVMDLPPGDPPYKIKDPKMPYAPDLNDSNLYAEFRRMYLLIKDHPNRPAGLKRIQMENVWVQMLEGVHHTEAAMLCKMKARELGKEYKGLTAAVVEEAFPGLLPSFKAE
jgi:hypothetical protein